MTHISLSTSVFTFLFILTGCQITQEEPSEVSLNKNNTSVATPLDVSQALLHPLMNGEKTVDESINVIHPVADIEFTSTKNNELLTNTTQDIWQDIRDKLSFTIPENKRLITQRNWYVRHPAYFERIAKRAEPFIYYIIQELEKNNVPIEMALLPIVESAYDPFAYSHGRASGMWQFVPDTGKRFGMKQNWWYDGRRDVIASTQGAIKYLKYLHKYFDNDWLLALAAYNSGEGRVRRAIKSNLRKNKPTDFWSLNLPKETRAYVPKLLALADIVKRPEHFNLNLYKINNSPVITQVDIGSQIDLAKAASLADISLTEMQRLNPGFNRWSTDPDGPHYLVIPESKKESFVAQLQKLDKKERLAWQRYKIKNGDNLGEIAKKFNTSVNLIKQVNNVSGTQIRAGKHLLIPVASQSLDSYILSQSQRLVKKQNRQRQGIKITHAVKTGDTLWDISQAYKVNSKKIAKWNAMAPKDIIKPGQKLVIWLPNKKNKSSGSPIEKAVIRNITYKVRSGDSFARIADKFNVLIKDIERWNQLNRKKYLQPGQLLKLSVDVTNNI